jgi:hypothetical protein
MKSLHFNNKAWGSFSTGAILIAALVTGGCAGRVKDIRDLPAERAAAIRVVVNTTSQGKILQDSLEKGVWNISGGTTRPRPVGNYEWYLWVGIDEAVYPLIPKGQEFVTNTSMIHEGDAAQLTLEYAVPTGVHRYLLGFAGLRPYVYSKGFSQGDEEGEVETRLGVTWKQCFSAQLRAEEVITVRIDDTGVHLPEGIQVEPLSNCNQWLFGPLVKVGGQGEAG